MKAPTLGAILVMALCSLGGQNAAHGAQAAVAPDSAAGHNSLSFTSAILVRDTWNMVQSIDEMNEMFGSGGNLVCQQRKLSSARITELPRNAELNPDGTIRKGSWKEEWILDRCGKQVPYTIQFTAEHGGTRMSVDRPFMPKPDQSRF